MTNRLKMKVYSTKEERHKALEEILIKISKIEVTGAKIDVVPFLYKIANIYEQAEEAYPDTLERSSL